MKHPQLISILFVASTLFGCDTSGSDATSDAGNSLSKPVNELTSDELMEICDLRDQIADVQFEKVACYLYLIQQEKEFGALCERDIEDCIAAPPPETAFLAASWRCVLPDELPACAAEVTAQELDECYTDKLAKFHMIEASVTCDFDTEDPSNDVDLVSSCQAINAQCPGLLDSL